MHKTYLRDKSYIISRSLREDNLYMTLIRAANSNEIIERIIKLCMKREKVPLLWCEINSRIFI